MSRWFSSEQIGSPYPKPQRRLLFRGGPKGVEPGSNSDVLESQTNPSFDELCLRQSAGDSTGPEVDIRPDVLAQLRLHHNVGKMQPATWTQHAGDLGESDLLLGYQVQDTV